MRRILFGIVAVLGLAAVPAAVNADDWHRGHGRHGHHGHHQSWRGHYHSHHDHYYRRPSYDYYRAPVYRIQPYPYGYSESYYPPRSGFYYRDNDFSIGIGF